MNIGVVGTGMIAKMIVPHLEEWGARVRAVCGTTRHPEATRELAAPFGATVYDDYAALLADDAVDTVYIAVPNHLHHPFTLQALAAGKHVILEKPFASNAAEAEEIAAAAREHGRFVLEAVSTVYLPNYEQIRRWLPRIGEVKVVSTNYSQYSSRYDAFRAGEVLPVFDPAKAGGALMDLGLYNMYYVLGLFGEPTQVRYLANVERGIDTSGIATLDYGSFKAVCVAAKDCAAPTRNTIQGTRGYILQTTPANSCGEVVLHLNDGTEERFDGNPELQWESEFRAFARIIDTHDVAAAEQALEQSLAVARTMYAARVDAGVRFPTDPEA